jgi:hypothetical protein
MSGATPAWSGRHSRLVVTEWENGGREGSGPDRDVPHYSSVRRDPHDHPVGGLSFPALRPIIHMPVAYLPCSALGLT